MFVAFSLLVPRGAAAHFCWSSSRAPATTALVGWLMTACG